MGHVVLLGDSIFDNAAYVPGGSPVIEQLRSRLPRGWRATLLAKDGAITRDILRQLAHLRGDCSHLIVSTGGNDALGHSALLHEESSSAAEEEFREDYREMLQAVRAVRKPIVLCTIYDSVPQLPRQAVTALSVYNDIILREGFNLGLPILDLRLICKEWTDYSSLSPIEPSEIGGARIVEVMCKVVTGHDFSQVESVVYRQ